MTGLPIGEVARRTGLSIDTLRYYEREGLTPAPVARDAGGRRRYSGEDLEWLHTVSRLRSTGMPIEEVRHYADLVREGDPTLQERISVFEAHEGQILERIAELEDALRLVREKIRRYRSTSERN